MISCCLPTLIFKHLLCPENTWQCTTEKRGKRRLLWVQYQFQQDHLVKLESSLLQDTCLARNVQWANTARRQASHNRLETAQKEHTQLEVQRRRPARLAQWRSFCATERLNTPTAECNPGTYSESAATICTMCIHGTFQDIPGQSACKPCT